MQISDEVHKHIAEQLVAQKEAYLKRAVGNALGGEPPGLTELQGRLECYTQPDKVEQWTFDGVHVLTLYPPQFIHAGRVIRATLQGVVHNEPEPEPLPESGEVVNYIPGREVR